MSRWPAWAGNQSSIWCEEECSAVDDQWSLIINVNHLENFVFQDELMIDDSASSPFLQESDHDLCSRLGTPSTGWHKGGGMTFSNWGEGVPDLGKIPTFTRFFYKVPYRELFVQTRYPTCYCQTPMISQHQSITTMPHIHHPRRHLWPLRNLISVTRKHDLTNKKKTRKTNTNTFKKHFKRGFLVVEEYYLLREVVKLLPFLTIENLKALQSRTKKTSNNGFKALYWFSFQLSIWSMVTE